MAIGHSRLIEKFCAFSGVGGGISWFSVTRCHSFVGFSHPGTCLAAVYVCNRRKDPHWLDV